MLMEQCKQNVKKQRLVDQAFVSFSLSWLIRLPFSYLIKRIPQAINVFTKANVQKSLCCLLFGQLITHMHTCIIIIIIIDLMPFFPNTLSQQQWISHHIQHNLLAFSLVTLAATLKPHLSSSLLRQMLYF